MIVLLSFIGIILVTLADAKNEGSKKEATIKGDLYSLFSAVCYGLYATWLKRRVKEEEAFPFGYFLGFVGLFNFVFLIPIFPLLDYMGVEKF